MKHVLAGVIASVFLCGVCAGQEIIDLGEIVVTPVRTGIYSGQITGPVTVISRDELDAAHGSTVADALRGQAGVQVRDYYGTGTRVAVDMRGFGEFAAQNVLVLIDGRRINSVDLSGVDWAQLPLDRIEKIEIYRGPATVLYGDNAAGGVIHVITRADGDEFAVSAEQRGGSYRMHKERFSVSGPAGNVSWAGDFVHIATGGYRENSDYESIDAGGRIGYDLTDNTALEFRGNYHDAELGLPGALRVSELKTYTRRQSKLPNDRVGETDGYAEAELSTDFTDQLRFSASAGFRHRRVDNRLYSSQLIDLSKISTVSVRPKLTLTVPGDLWENTLVAGADLYRTDTVVDEYSYTGMLDFYTGAKVRDTDIDKRSSAVYLYDVWSWNDRFSATAGYRREDARYTFDSTPQNGPWTADPFWAFAAGSIDESVKFDEEAVTAGVRYYPWQECSLFYNYSNGFRTPATDEYYSLWAVPPVNTDLKPQTHRSHDFGFLYRFSPGFSLECSWYTMKTDNELFYDPLTFSNANYDDTMRQGIEVDLRSVPVSGVEVFCRYSYTRAYFDSGVYDRKQVPLVPLHKAAAGVRSRRGQGFNYSLQVNFTGKRHFINDQAHAYPPLEEYLTVDCALSYTRGTWTWFGGINNVLNERYSEYGAISTVYAERGFYPSPERNLYAGLKAEF
ncbi:MAG: TonB-dependent receptor [Candidatus Omnitrophica bacterium]|nr:TonB-dependent receptor [Candidatus Omnitrophota bacterium]